MARKLAQEGESHSSDSYDAGRRTVDNQPVLERRSYLRLGAIAVGAATTAGLTQSATAASSEQHGDLTFDRVVDAVEDLGMDPTGREPIDAELNNAHEEGTLITFPPGDYSIANNLSISGSVSRFGISGTGESHEDVKFHFPNASGGYWFVHQRGGHDVLLENFTIVSDDKWVCVRLNTDDGGVIQDVEWGGFIPQRTENPAQLLDPGCPTTDGVNAVRRVVMGRNGTFVAGHGSATGAASMTGIRFYQNHAGETILDEVRMFQMGSNGVRHTQGDGVVTVIGGLYKNCHLAGLRIHTGDHPTKESTVTGTSIVIDHRDARPLGSGGFDSHGVNGLMLDSTGHGRAQPVFEDCVIECRSITTDGGWGLIRATNTGQSNPGGATFRNCRIVNHTELQTIRIDGREADADEPHHMTFEGVTVEVTAKSQPEDALFLLDSDWDGSTISDSTFYAPNGDVDGIRVRNCDGVVIEDTTIYASGRATVFENADVETINLSHEEPDEGEEDDAGHGDEEEGDDLPHQLRLIADEDADAFEYTFTVEGEVELVLDGDYPANEDGETVIDNDDGTMTVEGIVAGHPGNNTRWGGDTFRFAGTVRSFHKDGPATVYLDGEAINPTDLVVEDNEDPMDEETEDQLRIIAAEDANAFEYTFTVEGEAELVLDGDYPANESGETIIDNGDGTQTVEGVVAGYDGDDKRWGGDTFLIRGELLSFEKGGLATVLLNGEVIDVDEYTADNERVLQFVTELYAESVEYSFTVSGSVEQIQAGSVLDDGSEGPSTETVTAKGEGVYAVDGTLSGGERATYAVNGSIDSMVVTGPGEVTIDDDPVEPESYGLAEQLTIVGLGQVVSYKLTVDGDLAPDPNGPIDVIDDISGSSAEGAITDGVVSLRFDGSIVDFQLDGNAGVYLNGGQVSPSRLVSDEEPRLENRFTVHGVGSTTEYILEVSGSVHKAPDLGPVETDDQVENGVVIGTVTDESDGYRFDGQVESLWVFGNAEVLLNS